jgi:hypothetical protein
MLEKRCEGCASGIRPQGEVVLAYFYLFEKAGPFFSRARHCALNGIDVLAALKFQDLIRL